MRVKNCFLTFFLRGGVTLLTLLFLSCKHDPTDGLTGATSEYAMTVKYDMDVNQTRHPENPNDIGQMTNMEKLSCRPRLRRTHIEAYIRKDGSSVWLMKDLGHPQDQALPKLSPPSDQPNIVTTRVSGGMAKFYDKNDKLLYEQAVNMSAFEQMLEMIVNPSPKKTLEQLGLKPVINTATSNTAGSRTANLVTYSVTDSTTYLRKEIVVDTDKNYLVETTLYNANNQLMHRIDFDYADVLTNSMPMVERLFQTNRDISSNGTAIITQIITTITNLDIEDFMNP